jgi:D-alanyl-D-alanine carboxypeptidase
MLEDALATTVTEGQPGISAAIATRRGVVWTGTAGTADIHTGQPIDEATVFGIGSITKMFVAVVVLQLAEEGRLKRDDTPTHILGPKVTRGIANADTATVAQMLAHTSGIPSWEDDPRWLREGRGSAIAPDRQWGKTDALDFVRGKPAVHRPGTAFSYSNSGFTLLGLMIEAVTGNTAAAEIRQRVLDPLALKDICLEGYEPCPTDRLPRRYHHATETFRHDAGVSPHFPMVRPGLMDVTGSNLSVEWTAGGMISSPRDLVTFASALRDGQLLKPESLAFMETWAPARPNADMGHSLFRTRNAHGVFLGHNGRVLGFTGSLWWAAQGDAIVAVLTNVGTIHAGASLTAAADIALNSHFTDLALRYAEQTNANVTPLENPHHLETRERSCTCAPSTYRGAARSISVRCHRYGRVDILVRFLKEAARRSSKCLCEHRAKSARALIADIESDIGYAAPHAKEGQRLHQPDLLTPGRNAHSGLAAKGPCEGAAAHACRESPVVDPFTCRRVFQQRGANLNDTGVYWHWNAEWNLRHAWYLPQ